MASERSPKHYPLNPFTELLTDEEKLSNVQDDLTAMSAHRTRGIPDGRYLDLADQWLYHGNRERERLK
jgi:hypothetical protein